MHETLQETITVPPPIPVHMARPANLAESAPSVPLSPVVASPPLPPTSIPAPTNGPTDKMAIASSVCGLTPFIPIFSQVVGLILGVWAMFRIRRARRAGQNVRGQGWATAGIAGNGFVLLGWIMLFGMFAALKGTLNDTTNKLGPLLNQPAAHHARVRK